MDKLATEFNLTTEQVENIADWWYSIYQPRLKNGIETQATGVIKNQDGHSIHLRYIKIMSESVLLFKQSSDQMV